jgi:O-antigen/teichoic acid export membrane protein
MTGSTAAPPATNRPRLRVSAGTTFGRKLAVAALSLANVLVIARVLGPTGRGDVVFATTLATIAAQFATMSVQEANINFAGRDPALRPKLASTSLVIALVAAVLSIAALAALITLVPGLGGETTASVRWLAYAAIPALILATYLERLLDSDYRFAFENLASLLTPVAILSANGALALADALTVRSAVGAWVGGIVLGTLARVVYVSRRLGGYGRPDAALAFRMLRFGVRAHGARVMGWGNYRVDQLFVGTMAGSRELGLYSYAVSWAETLYYLPQTLVSVQRPDLVRATRREAGRLAAAIFRAAILVSAAAAVALVVLAPVLCNVLAGDDFAGSVDDLRVLVVGTCGILALQLLGSALTAQQRPELETAATGVALVATIVLDLLLIPPFGGLGAAAASAGAYTAGGVAAVLLASRTLGVRGRELIPRDADAGSLQRLAIEIATRGRRTKGRDAA